MTIPKTHCGPHKMPSVPHMARVFVALVYMVVKLHWNKYLLHIKFSYREHCWWLTSQTCVNTLIRQQLSINLRYCYSSRRATQDKSATRNSPTIGLNLHASPLSAFTVSLGYLPRRLHSIVAYGKTPTTVTWSASSKIWCHVIVTHTGVREGILLGGRKKYALKITICPESNNFP